MSKTIPSGLAAHQALGTTTQAVLLKITRTDAAVYAFTSASADITIDAVTYGAGPGLDISGIVLSAGLAVDNLELTTLDDGSTFTHAEVLTGRWRNAAFEISRVNYLTPTDGVEPIMSGTIGDVRLQHGSIVAELRGLQQYLQQQIGAVTTKTCRARLGDTLCAKNLTAFTFAATVTGVTSNQVFAASALTQDDDYFGNGILTWTGGNNDGLEALVKTHTTGGNITLMLPMLLTVQVGDTLSIVAGCRKRHERSTANPAGVSDCFDKFDNVLNFQGERLLPGIDALTKPV